MQQLFRRQSVISREIYLVLAIAVSILLAFELWPEPTGIPSLSNYWKEIPVTFSLVERIAPTCNQDESHFRACFKTIQVVLKYLQVPIVPTLIREPNPQVALVAGDPTKDFPSTKQQHEFFEYARELRFDQVFNSLHNLIHGNPAEAIITGSALNAWIGALDPHSGLFPRDYIRKLESAPGTEDSTLGVGVNFRKLEERCIVTNIIYGSTAEKVGISGGDEILSFDEFNCAQYTSLQLTEFLRERVLRGKKIHLELLRGSKHFALELSPQKIELNSVESKIEHDIAKIQIQNFYQTNTCSLVESAVKQALEKGVHGIIIDVRNNPGGYIEEAACTAGIFIGAKQTMATFFPVETPLTTKNGSEIPFLYAPLSPEEQKQFALLTNHEQMTRLPLVILLNQATASSAEIFAGALKDYDRAWLVGARSFGKGTMQTSFLVPNLAGVQFSRTTHRILLPSGSEIQMHGVRPHFIGAEAKDAATPREEDLFPEALKPLEAPVEAVQSGSFDKLNSCLKREKVISSELLAERIFSCSSH